ncbi:hypothetical protein VY88_20200 [Azospirillum thiophilum]|uniref:HTH lysR-type domain-containing protein n=2 Tax=Azospirillum thiophilum TaxID=528244 RepID=A0AAC8W3M2_9PROT|nr:hypothetical protein AL072_25770 [Azospirillum thiophilum]KJR63984.1 hypothetical protein VY88_20200 [Azospirillum thiophilum]
MPRFGLKQISAFRSVMISGTTSQAASLLNISQPAVSRLIHNLESQIAVELFIRRNGRLYPTPEAEALFLEVDKVYGGLDRIGNLLQNISLLHQGHLRLVVSVPMAQRLLPQALADFQKTRPDINVSIKVVVRREMREWLDAQQFEVALATFPIDYPAEHVEHLATLNGVCVMPAGHRLAELKVVRAADLEGEPFISIIPETKLRRNVDELFEREGVGRRLLIETQTGAAICDLVAAGLGVSVVDPFTASAFTAKGLAIRPFRPVIRFDFGLLLPMRRPTSLVAREFMQALHRRAEAIAEEFKHC